MRQHGAGCSLAALEAEDTGQVGCGTGAASRGLGVCCACGTPQESWASSAATEI